MKNRKIIDEYIDNDAPSAPVDFTDENKALQTLGDNAASGGEGNSVAKPLHGNADGSIAKNAEKTAESDEPENGENENGEKPSKGKFKKKIANYSKHLTACPHCGKDVLDHFTECPYCGGALLPSGYHADEQKLKKANRISRIVGGILSFGLVLAIFIIIIVKSK